MGKLGRSFFLTAFVSLLTACGGADNIGGGTSTPTTPGTGTPSTPGTPGGTPVTPVIRMGTLNGSTFTPGMLSVSNSPLDAGGSSGIRVDIVDTANNNTPVTDSVSVAFNSACVSANQSTITSPVTTSTGNATTTYRAQGCSGNDIISATATINGTSLSASGSITVRPSSVSSITFVSAAPSSIRLRGSGQPDTSIVTFEVRNVAGGPVVDQSVVFSLDTRVGGITLNPTTGKTDSTGRVSTTVNSGSVSTAVRVTATTGISGIPPAQSDSLVISTGLADQDSFSMSVGCFNIEGNSFDGVQTDVAIRAADRFNNPVPDGTAISFRSETGAAIDSRCFTANGGCSVKVTSQGSRQADHRVTIVAAAIGEESFTDLNGNGRFDNGEPFIDLGEAFQDNDENGTRSSSNEPFFDFNSDGIFQATRTQSDPDRSFTGVLCNSGCDPVASSLNVRDSSVIIMSGSDADITILPNIIDLTNGPVPIRVLIRDSAGQVMPGDTSVMAVTTVGVIEGGATLKQPCTTEPGPFQFNYTIGLPTLDQPPEGTLTITVTTPKGVVTKRTASVVFRSEQAPPPPDPPPAKLGQMQFVAADPSTIGLRGSGRQETSTVTFKVVTANGAPVEGQVVNFTLDTNVGGIELSSPSATSDAGGLVTTIVRSGTVHTAVRVRATATQGDVTVNAASDRLTVTTGIPDQDSFSLTLACANIEAFTEDGQTTVFTARGADRFNNPVPNGTSIAFTTEGGAIVGDCVTTDGGCSVTWTGQNPRPVDGRSTVLATALGEESFIDLNGNGQYDEDLNGDGVFNDNEPFSDLDEAFRDDNSNGVYDSSSEEFLDFNVNRRKDAPSGTFTGTLCNSSRGGCDPIRQLNVRASRTVVMSGSTALVDGGDINITNGSYDAATNTFSIVEGQTAVITFTIRDKNNQPMPARTQIFLDDGGTSNLFVNGNSTATTAISTVCQADDSIAANQYSFAVNTFSDGDNTDESDTLRLRITSPRGITTNNLIYPVRIIDDDLPSVSLSVTSANINETGGTSNVVATLSSATDKPVTVTLAYSGNATINTDFTGPTSLVIPAGQTSTNSVLSSIGDAADENDESIFIDIAAVTNAVESGTQSVFLRIFDDD